MPISVRVEVRGLREVQANMERTVRELHGAPMLNAFRDCTLIIQRDARIGSPVDTGRLRASITPEVRTEGDDVLGVVGSNVAYAPYMELGTKAHMPPIAALETWARRHGTSAFLVARAISRRGIKARRFLQGAFEKNKDRIIKRIERAVKEIAEGK